MSNDLFNVWKEFRFDAAHQLDAGPEGDPRYRRLHGHSYQVEVWVRGPRTAFGWVVDMGDLERRFVQIHAALDHRFLNEVEGLGAPTMENIAAFVWAGLSDLPQLHRVMVKRQQNGEGCEYYGPASEGVAAKGSALDPRGALVLFSGGQDSTTCLAWALERFDRVETLGFHYGQNHAVEMTVREHLREELARINPEWARRLGSDYVHDAAVIADVAHASLTGRTQTILRSEGLPDTFVPGRNLVFLTLAAALAYRRGLQHIVTGVCETDYSGYPDCRNETMQALQRAVRLGTDADFTIQTPLMWITKAQTWAMAEQLGGDALVSLIRTGTHTCYRGDRSIENEWGFGCGECPACQLRANGWNAFSKELLGA